MYFRAFLFGASRYGRMEMAAEADLSPLTAAEQIASQLYCVGKKGCKLPGTVLFV